MDAIALTSVDYRTAGAVLEHLAERDQRRRRTYPRSTKELALRAAHAEFQRAGADAAGRVSYAVTLVYNPPRIPVAGPCRRLLADGSVQEIAAANQVRDSRAQPARVNRDLDRLHRDVDRAMYGSHYTRFGPDRRTAYRGIIEAVEANIHVHLTWSVPSERTDEFPDVVARAWRQYARGGSVVVDQIRDDGWGWYCTKCSLSDLDDPELLVISRKIGK